MPSQSTSHSASQHLMSGIRALPLWVKQVVFADLYRNMVEHFTPESLQSMSLEDTIALYVPQLTPAGEKALSEAKGEVGQLLKAAKDEKTVLDVCLHLHWSLETCCRNLIEAFDAQWLALPHSPKAQGTIEYLANRIRLGEYLVRMGYIMPEQLDQALRTQQYIQEALKERTGIANILINLGYITRKDTEAILFLKQESAKPLEDIPLLKR